MMAIPAVLAAASLSLSTTTAVQMTTPSNWGFELRLGTYRPQIGTESIGGGRTERDYFREYFGTKRPMMVALQFDRYLMYAFGLLGVYGRIGHWKIAGHTRVCTDDAGAQIACTADTVFDSTTGSDSTSLVVVPLSLGVVYRLDILNRRWGIPVVAYGKGGLDYFLWWSTGGTGVSQASGRSGKGGTAGYHAGAGLALSLNWMESTGGLKDRVFQDSFLFAEWTRTWADSFGDKARLAMSARQWMFGLSFEFE